MKSILRRVSWLNVAAITMIVTGIVIALIGRNTLRWAPPPVPPAWAAADHGPAGVVRPAHRAVAARSDSATAPKVSLPSAVLLAGHSSPVSIDIPAIGVHAKVIALGLTRNGAVAVPPLTDPRVTSWYDKGPAPGQLGAAAILGHVDAASVGPAVFYKLGNLRPGAKIYVTLHDHRTVIYETYAVALYPKARFPTAKVYGYTSWPTLRLITCGGLFDPNTGHYLGNVVAYASYIGTRPASDN
jgi:Sortase domain